MVDKTKFINKDSSWELTNSGMFFLDKQVTISVDTKTNTDHPDKEIFNDQIKTLNIIENAWDELVVIIEREIIEYENLSKAELLKVMDRPKIWLCMDYDTNKPTANNSWSFVLGVTDNEDFGWHVEFEGKTHSDTWAGG